MDNRWQKDKKFKPARNLSPMVSAMRIEMVRSAMDQQAMLARQENKTYSGCGVTISANDGPQSELSTLGYGNRIKGKYAWAGGKDKVKDGKCVNCQEDGEVGEKDWCQKCISGHCGSK
jgi:hypothetical protein